MERWRKVARNVLICASIVLVTVVIDYFVQDYIYKNGCEIVEDDFSHVFQIDSVEEKNNKLVLTGWVFELDKDSEEDDFEIILYDYNNYKEYYMDVEDIVREDVNAYFLCNYDYSNVGFNASIKAGKLELYENNYEVLIRPKDVRKAYKTGTYISNGEMVFTEPESFVTLDVEGTGLEEIVNDGVLRVYRPDVGICVYQYEWDLYWIADENYKLEEDGSTFIQYQLDTTQIDKLPKNRLDNKWYWDNINFKFEKNEISNIDTGDYRVSVERLPLAYSVEKIWTGYHKNNTWQWRQYFRPWYEFE